MARTRLIAAISLASLTTLALAAAPGGAQTQTVNTISAKDKQTGAQAHPELLQEFGGAYNGSQANYVTRIGQKIAFQSGIAGSEREFTVTLLNSPVNNAFAIPGGYVYVTRQLMALMNDEAELASVLGHEVGHVAARHGQQRQKTASRNAIIGAILQIATGVALGGDSQVGQLLQQGIGSGVQLVTLKYGRTQEYEADDLGISYLARAGYDPAAASTMLASLAAQTAIEARVRGGDARSTPEWASTHPDPGSRVKRALTKAKATGKIRGVRNADPFLTALNGVLYDDDPRHGITEGRNFLYPDGRFQFTVPQGFGMANGSNAVAITGNGGSQAQFAGGPMQGGTLAAHVDSVFRGLAGKNAAINYGQIQRTRINGMDAAYASAQAKANSGQVQVTVFAYQLDGNTAYHFLTLTPVGSANGFDGMFQSFRRMTTAEAAAVRPRKVQVVSVKRGDTIASLSAQMAYDSYRRERFLVLNALTSGAALRTGQRVKIVTY
ncbi:M48 family metalloprotease [Sphingobium boeckii]|uniref:Putative Zn-dependent protease n=1 Tax=Sphingobium boeckii TaxID=1082345 RepID=A0A7W9AJU0_9SPHN|nr:M48 family metalloprotease [Sphingobium boeckii]MBB5686970.1 putative Zn-dependent protease [Sphingobium boeckii]